MDATPPVTEAATPAETAGCAAQESQAGNTVQPAQPFRWNKTVKRAACMVAAEKLPMRTIARQCRISPATLYQWVKAPEFQRKVAQLREIYGELAARYEISRQAARLAELQKRWDGMRNVIRQRAADPDHQSAPGGDTGLLVRQQKMLGKGDNSVLVNEFVVDTGLLREMRELEKQAAQEAGQWAAKPEADPAVVAADQLMQQVARLVVQQAIQGAVSHEPRPVDVTARIEPADGPGGARPGPEGAGVGAEPAGVLPPLRPHLEG